MHQALEQCLTLVLQPRKFQSNKHMLPNSAKEVQTGREREKGNPFLACAIKSDFDKWRVKGSREHSIWRFHSGTMQSYFSIISEGPSLSTAPADEGRKAARDEST